MNRFFKLKFSFQENIEEKCLFLIKIINSFSKNFFFKSWVNNLSLNTKIEEKEIKFFFKKQILNSYNFNKNKFTNKLNIINLLFYILYYHFFLIKALLTKENKEKKNYKLIIDNIGSAFELDSYNEILKYIPKNQIIVRTLDNKIKSKKFKVLYYKHTHITFKEYFYLFNFSFKTIINSFYLNINLFYLLINYLKTYLFFKSFFKNFKSHNIIMHQHYISNNIKNILFKRHGGKLNCLIQKNINTRNSNGYFYHSDIIFGFSKKTRINPSETFSKINSFIDCGSFFFNKNKSLIKKNNKNTYDILYLGGNDLVPGGYYDTYKNYKFDYLEQLEWLKKMSNENKNIKIGFKHHTNNNCDFEKEYLKKSNVIFIDQSLNSYNLAFNSKFIVSWASTMIIEITALGKYCYFLNPKKRNFQFLKDIKGVSEITIYKYNDFKKKFHLAKKNNFKKKYKNEFCKNNGEYFKNIVKNLII